MLLKFYITTTLYLVATYIGLKLFAFTEILRLLNETYGMHQCKTKTITFKDHHFYTKTLFGNHYKLLKYNSIQTLKFCKTIYKFMRYKCDIQQSDDKSLYNYI